MKHITAALKLTALFAILTIAFTACSGSDSNVDDQIRFAENGNIYMSQELCDAEDPDISAELEQRVKDWWADKLAGKHDGEVICTD